MSDACFAKHIPNFIYQLLSVIETHVGEMVGCLWIPQEPSHLSGFEQIDCLIENLNL